jgi:hypothetical protein
VKPADSRTIHDLFSGPTTRADRSLLWMLVAVAAIDLLSLIYLSLFPGGAAAVYWLGTIYLGGAAILALGVMRLRHHSLTAVAWFLCSIVLFHTWNIALLFARGLLIAWLHAPIHLAVVAILGLVPLAIGMWQIETRAGTAS